MNYKAKIIIFIILLAIIKIYHDNNKALLKNLSDEYFETQYDDIQIVIPRYNEDLSWINNYPFNEFPLIIYNKGLNDHFMYSQNIIKVINLPNVGRCDHTYLYHIINNYYNLPEVTIFLPGSINLPHKYERSEKLVNKVKETMSTVFACYIKEDQEYEDIDYSFAIDSYRAMNPINIELNTDYSMKQSETRPYGEWFKKIFKNHEKNRCVAWNGIFAISKKYILRKPISFYEDLIIQLNDHHNPEAGHYFERSWYAIFFPYDNDIFVSL